MKAECNQESFEFQALGGRDVAGRFDGGRITSDGGGLLLRETEQATGIIGQFAACFTDHRDSDLIEHTVEELIGQRIYGLALGHEEPLFFNYVRDILLALGSDGLESRGHF